MKRYVKRIYDDCSVGTMTRREVRQPRIIEMNENNYQQYHTQQLSPTISPSYRGFDQPYDPLCYSQAEARQYVFETVCFATMIWIEEDFSQSTGESIGHFDIFKSYAYVPMGDDLPSMELHGEGQSMYDNETRPIFNGGDPNAFYQWRIGQLESRLRDLEESDRIILPREEIQEIHQDVRRHFDDQLFELE